MQRARALAAAAPDDPDRHFTLGLAQSEQDVAGAIASFRRALEIAPRHALARYNLALVLRRADRLPEAIAELERALAIEPRAEVHYTLGVIYWHQGEAERAEGALRAAVAAQPDYADAHYTLGAVLRSRRDWKGAAASLRRAIALRPEIAGGALHARPGPAHRAAMSAAPTTDLAEAERLRQRAQAGRRRASGRRWGSRQLDDGDADGAIDCLPAGYCRLRGATPPRTTSSDARCSASIGPRRRAPPSRGPGS